MIMLRSFLVMLLLFSPWAQAQEFDLQGTYVTLIEDHPHAVKTRHFVRTPYGRVEITDPRSQLETGRWVNVRGRLNAEGLVEALDTTAPKVLALASVLPNTLGQQTTAVVLVRFQDDATTPNKPEIESLVFGASNSVDQFMRRSSFEQTWLSGQVFDAVTVPYNRNTCPDMMLLTQQADNALMARGQSLQGYQRRLYVFPKNSCSWTGLALVGETPGVAWINGSYTLKAMAHEYGHMLGLRHAHALDCNSTPTGDTCTNLPYGDVADIMGNVRTGDYSAPMKVRLGWLGDGVSPDVLTANATGRYTLDSYSTSSVGPKALRIPRGVNAQGQTMYLYAERRTHVGNDAILVNQGNLTQGLMIRQATEGDGDSIYQLDMTPNSATGSVGDLTDGALNLNASYTDPMSQIRITLMQLTSDGVVVDVAYPNTTPPTPVCTRQKPTITMSTSTPTVVAGAQVDYTVWVQNNDDPDNSACTPQRFVLAHALPSGLSAMWVLQPLDLSAGQKGKTTLRVQVNASISPNTYTLSATATGPTGLSDTAQASLTVKRNCPQPARFGWRLNTTGPLFFDTWISNAGDMRCTGNGVNEGLPSNGVGVGVPVSPAPTPVRPTPAQPKPTKPVRSAPSKPYRPGRIRTMVR